MGPLGTQYKPNGSFDTHKESYDSIAALTRVPAIWGVQWESGGFLDTQEESYDSPDTHAWPSGRSDPMGTLGEPYGQRTPHHLLRYLRFSLKFSFFCSSSGSPSLVCGKLSPLGF
jgi:hypothetical protein